MCRSKLLIGLIGSALLAQGRQTLTPTETETRAQASAKLRTAIEAAPKLPLEQKIGAFIGVLGWC